MHARAFLFSVLAGAFVAPPGGLAASAPTASTFVPATPPARPAKSASWVGAPKETVAARFGMPSEIVSPQLWIYREFATDYQNANERGFDTLAVAFVAGKVQTIRLVNGAALTALLAASRRAQAAQFAEARTPSGRK